MSSIYNWEYILELAKNVVEESPEITKKDLAKTLGIPRTTLSDAMEREWYVTEVEDILDVNLLEYQYKDNYIRIEGDAIIIGDVEVPYQNDSLLRKAVKIGNIFGIEQLIVNGDFLSLDSVSKWKKDGEQTITSLEDELSEGKRVLKYLSKQFNKMYFVRGNHEDRLIRKTDGNMNMRVIISMIAPDTVEAKTTSFKHLELNNDFIVGHPDNYSKIPGRTGNRLVRKYNKSVILGHQHHMSRTWDESGQYEIIDGGHCTLPQSRFYKTASFTTHPDWISGFVLAKQGAGNKTYIHLFPEKHTDWNFWFK